MSGYAYRVWLPCNSKLISRLSSPYQPAYSIGNASITWQAASGKWSLGGYGNDVTNRQYVVSGDSNYGIGFHEAEFNRPREWGVRAEVDF